MSMRTISVRKFSGAETTNCLKPSQSLLKNPELSLKLPPTADDPLKLLAIPTSRVDTPAVNTCNASAKSSAGC